MHKFYIFFSIPAIFCIYYLFSTFIPTKKDKDNYQDLIERKSILTSCSNIQKAPITQKRKNISKDIYLIQGNKRLHYSIFCKSSELIFFDKKSIKMVENLKDIECLFQDSVENNMQKLRYFTADRGTYTYPHQFFTDKANICFFNIEGNVLPKDINTYQPYLKGFANNVSFKVTEKIPEFTAKHFRAHFYR